MTCLRSIVFAVLFMCMGSKSAVAWQIGFDSNLNPIREIQAEGIIITWSEENDELRGFSQKLGEWEVLKTDPQKLNPGQIIIPIVAANVAAVRIGDSIAAFSGEKGWWDVVDLAKGAGSELTAYPTVSPSLVKVEDNGHLYTFSASKGQWSSPTDPELQPATAEFEVDLRSAEAGNKAVTEWLESLPKHRARGLRVAISYRDGKYRVKLEGHRNSWFKSDEVKVRELFASSNDQAAGSASAANTALHSENIDLAPKDLDGRLQKLKAEFQQLELAVQAGSGQLSNRNVDQDQQSRELRKLVEQSFDLRQQLQELEAQRLRLKLQQVENNLAVRAKSRDAMVENRMEELRRPDSGTKVPQQEPDNRSTSRDNSVGSESIDSTVNDVRIENANSKIQWLQPREVARLLRGLRESAISDIEAIRIKKGSVETWSQPLEKLIADGRLKAGSGEDQRRSVLANAEGKAKELEINLNGTRRDWSHAWSGYQTQLELLRLDVEQAKSKADLLTSQYTRASGLHAVGVIAREKLDEISVSFTESKVSLQRAEHMLKLYTDIEANEPELNPTTLKGLDEITANKEVTESVPSEPGQNLPQQVISMAEQLRKLREAAVKIREEGQPHANLITQYSRPLEQLKAESVISAETTEEDLKTQIARSKPEFDRLTRELDTATKAWKQAWSAYQSQSRLLELEVQDAENSLASAEQTLAHIHAKSDQGLVGSQEVRDTEARRSAAVVQHEKSRELLHLWQEMEKNEPELNPDWKPESSGKNVPE